MVYRHLVNFWPLVPAIDVQAVYEASKSSGNKERQSHDFELPYSIYKQTVTSSNTQESGNKQQINILIFGDGIGCLIKTLARTRRHNTLSVNIYVVSNFAESFARQLLLLSLFNDATLRMGVLEKSEIFLEIFGNTQIRASTSSFLEAESGKILDDILNTRQNIKSVPGVSLDFLKQKEIDEVCEVFRYLKNRELRFDVERAWQNSLRAFYGTRYDNRKNIFDYNFNMRLTHYSIINLKKYLHWCESGIAFQLRKGRYDTSNKSLCIISSSSRKSKSYEQYFGDITTSPYVAFGVECDNEEVFKKVNNQNSYTSQDISKLNISDFMTEIIAGEKSEISRSVNIFFLFYSTFCKSQQFENFFDAVYVTSEMRGWAENHLLSKVMNENGVAIFETIHNVVYSTKEQRAKCKDDIDALAEKSGLKPQTNLKYCNDNMKVYKMSNEKK